MLRLKDLVCVKCGDRLEAMVVVGDPLPRHCGKEPREVIGAPMVHYKPHYSHALGKNVERWSDEEKALEAKGQWIATKAEANSNYGTDIFTDNVAIKQATEESTRKHVEKAAAKLARDGIIRSGVKGWEYTGPTDSA